MVRPALFNWMRPQIEETKEIKGDPRNGMYRATGWSGGQEIHYLIAKRADWRYVFTSHRLGQS
jgi:hypothetical protein